MSGDALLPTAFDTRAFRNALGCFPTGVVVITAKPEGRSPVGLTVNSFASVSLDPPLVLWSLRRDAPSKEAILEADHFVVNVLDEDQLDLARHFAKPATDKFDGVNIVANSWGAPYLANSVARFECKILDCINGGDHVIFLGKVEYFTHSAGTPLVFYHGMFASLDNTGKTSSG